MLQTAIHLQSKKEYIVFCEPSIPQILITMKVREQIIKRTKQISYDTMYKEDLGLISKARKISNHPYLLFWDEGSQKLTFEMLKSDDGDEIKDREQLVSHIFETREKSGKFKILEKLLKQWHKVPDQKNKVLVFSQTKIVLDIASLILSHNEMKFKVRQFDLTFWL